MMMTTPSKAPQPRLDRQSSVGSPALQLSMKRAGALQHTPSAFLLSQ